MRKECSFKTWSACPNSQEPCHGPLTGYYRSDKQGADRYAPQAHGCKTHVPNSGTTLLHSIVTRPSFWERFGKKILLEWGPTSLILILTVYTTFFKK